MAWPNAQTAYLATGVTSIRWGTDGVLSTSANGNGSGGYAGFYTVESIRANDEVDTMYIEQGNWTQSNPYSALARPSLHDYRRGRCEHDFARAEHLRHGS